jgi:CheY-like chemotaxis protein
MPEEKSVLIIDDDAATRSVVTAVLERAGYRTAAAADAAEAVELLTGAQYSAILLDYKMPHDGVALIDYISQNLPELLAHTIVLISAVNRPIWGVLTKPVEPNELISAVTDCASGAAA